MTFAKPWMADKRNVSSSDLLNIISDNNGIQMLPSRAMDEVYPRLYVGEA